MNFEREEKGCCSNEEEDDEEGMRENPLPFPPPTSPASSNCHNLWLGNFDSPLEAAPAADFDRKLGLMDLSLGCANEESSASAVRESSGDKPAANMEKEHMFDKVVTPSDVGKLNRLVIPKQHAEKYFPLDSSSNERGLLLNFEDRNGKSWRFRYSYWNSSQSYVMTKGWSRFVKDKKLNAGDIVSFQRGVGEVGKGRFFIDWRRHPDLVVPDPRNFGHFQFQNQLSFAPPSVRWERFYSLQQTAPFPRSFEPFPRLNYGGFNPYDHHQYHQHYHQQQLMQPQLQAVDNGKFPQFYARSSASNGPQIDAAQGAGGGAPIVIDSLPVVVPRNKTEAGKRLRLFGVNMDCAKEDDSSSSSSSSLQSRMHPECSKKGKSSLSFDFDL